ncbi:MAG TPA: hypothetical protein ENJ43_03935 [Gammaproteobacteria bacterium]|nr:hypothetical protein [Gammaproteobacteria bacterium]
MVAKKRTTNKKNATATKVAGKAAPAKKRVKAIPEPMTKAVLHRTIAERTGLAKKDVTAVFDTLDEIIEGHLKKRGAGMFTLPGLMKLRVVRKPARRARKGINPFTGEEMMFKAKPAHNVIKISPLKKLKEKV